MTTGIEWTDETWNPVVGCSVVSPGCDNCYAARDAGGRLRNHPLYAGLATKEPGQPARFTGEVRTVPDRLDAPLHWRAPRRVFVNSTSDLFHPSVPDEFIADVFAVMSLAPRHHFQVLTKRPQRMEPLLGSGLFWIMTNAARMKRGWPVLRGGGPVCLPNVWLGVSVENQRYADLRIPHLLATPAAVRLLSCEPLLGPVALDRWLRAACERCAGTGSVKVPGGGAACPACYREEIGRGGVRNVGIDWVIAGGESGHGARPTHPDHARSLRDQCIAAGVPFFFKQWGTWVPYETDPQPPFFRGQDGQLVDGHHLPSTLTDHEPVKGWWWPDVDEDPIYRRRSKKAGGRLLDGRTWLEFPRAAPTWFAGGTT